MWGALVVCGLVGCSPSWLREAPDFPENAPQGGWEVPLLDPLTSLPPSVNITVRGPESDDGIRPERDVRFFVDSGATLSTMPRALWNQLGIENRPLAAYTKDASGAKTRMHAGTIESMRLGNGLELSNVVAAVSPNHGLLGANVLGQHTWEMDLDRGVLRVDGDAWAASEAQITVPTRLENERRYTRTLSLGVSGNDVPILLDTGAQHTMVDRQSLEPTAARERILLFPVRVQSLWGSVSVHSAYQGDFDLGGRPLSLKEVAAHPGLDMASAKGLLGWDVLSAYRFQVRGDSLSLSPRKSLLESRVGRINRWPDAPHCMDLPGCIEASLEHDATNVSASLRVYADYTRPTRFLFGCLNAEGELSHGVWTQVIIQNPRSGTLVVARAIEGGSTFWQRFAENCTTLVPLDANPISPEEDYVAQAAPWPELKAVGDARNWRLPP